MLIRNVNAEHTFIILACLQQALIIKAIFLEIHKLSHATFGIVGGAMLLMTLCLVMFVVVRLS
jgi:hypothetical protein